MIFDETQWEKVSFKVRAFALGNKSLQNAILLNKEEEAKAYHLQINQSEEVIHGGEEALKITPFNLPECFSLIQSNYLGRFFGIGKESNKIYTWDV